VNRLQVVPKAQAKMKETGVPVAEIFWAALSIGSLVALLRSVGG